MNLELIYWRFFNFFIPKLVGVAFMAVGLLFTTLSLYELIKGNNSNLNWIEADDVSMKAIILIMSVVISAFGIMMLKAKPYYQSSLKKPDDNDT